MTGIPANAKTIYAYLLGHGATPNAAAGILGNIEQESGGNPSAGVWPNNYGIIQWTPASNYFNSPPSLAQQLAGMLSYINGNGGMGPINAHADTPQDAALYFSQKYERPAAAYANNANREGSAALVAQAAHAGNLGNAAQGPVTGGTQTVGNPITGAIGGAMGDALSGLWSKAEPVVVTMGFAAAGLGLVVAGLVVTSKPIARQVEQIVPAAATLAAA